MDGQWVTLSEGVKAYEQKLRAKLDELQAEVDKLKARIRGAEADARIDREEEIDRLEAKREERRDAGQRAGRLE